MPVRYTRLLGIVFLWAFSSSFAGCPATILPDADFTAGVYSGEAPLAVVFGDASQPGMEAITSWHWEFGDGQSADTQHVNHLYRNVGRYTVSLTASDSLGSDTETKTEYINVFRAPVPDFMASPRQGAAPLQVTFTNTSVPGSGTLPSVFWNFGDGASSGDIQPTHTYTKPGTYDVYMYAIDENGARPIKKKGFIKVE